METFVTIVCVVVFVIAIAIMVIAGGKKKDV